MASFSSLSNAKHISSLFLGKCLPCLKYSASKFKVQYFYFDRYLKMYFRKSSVIFAYDPQKICKSGDVALIRELQHKISRSINHEVLEVVYPCGDVTDPVTGKKVVSTKSRDEMDMIHSLYGNVDSSFKYQKAPRRGWQEGIRDFTHRESYLRYNEFDDDDENKQPDSVAY